MMTTYGTAVVCSLRDGHLADAALEAELVIDASASLHSLRRIHRLAARRTLLLLRWLFISRQTTNITQSVN